MDIFLSCNAFTEGLAITALRIGPIHAKIHSFLNNFIHPYVIFISTPVQLNFVHKIQIFPDLKHHKHYTERLQHILDQNKKK